MARLHDLRSVFGGPYENRSVASVVQFAFDRLGLLRMMIAVRFISGKSRPERRHLGFFRPV